MDAVTITNTGSETTILVGSISMKSLKTGTGFGLGIIKEQIPDDGKIVLGIRYDVEDDRIIVESIM